MLALKDALKRSGRSQAWVARWLTDEGIVPMKHVTLSSYLNGRRRISWHVLVELCKIADIPLERVTSRIGNVSELVQDGSNSGKGKPASNV